MSLGLFPSKLDHHDRGITLDVSDPTDPEVIIKIDVVNTFNSTDRGVTLDVLSGHTSRNFVCDLKIGLKVLVTSILIS